MKIEEVIISEADITDAGKRIDTIVERFRSTAGKEFYTWKLRYNDDSKVIEGPFGLIILLAILAALIFKGAHIEAGLYVDCIILFFVVIAYARTRVQKEKEWKNDPVSKKDILYL